MKFLAGLLIGGVLALGATQQIGVNCVDFWNTHTCAVKTPWSITLTKTP